MRISGCDHIQLIDERMLWSVWVGFGHKHLWWLVVERFAANVDAWWKVAIWASEAFLKELCWWIHAPQAGSQAIPVMRVFLFFAVHVPSNPDVGPPGRRSRLLCFVIQTIWTICWMGNNFNYLHEESTSAPTQQYVEWWNNIKLSL